MSRDTERVASQPAAGIERPAHPPAPAAPEGVLHLQATAGNQAVTRHLARLRNVARSPDGVQVRSPAVEEAVTQISGGEAGVHGRPLGAAERQLAQPIFGTSIDYDRVRLIP